VALLGSGRLGLESMLSQTLPLCGPVCSGPGLGNFFFNCHTASPWISKNVANFNPPCVLTIFWQPETTRRRCLIRFKSPSMCRHVPSQCSTAHKSVEIIARVSQKQKLLHISHFEEVHLCIPVSHSLYSRIFILTFYCI
jgi:hypothetical protein